jgi:hypothetical protein
MKKVCRDKNNEEKFSDPIANNGLRAGEVFYFGLSAHFPFVKNIAIKLNKFQPKSILQYF